MINTSIGVRQRSLNLTTSSKTVSLIFWYDYSFTFYKLTYEYFQASCSGSVESSCRKFHSTPCSGVGITGFCQYRLDQFNRNNPLISYFLKNCTIKRGVQAVGGFKPEARGKCQLKEVPVGEVPGGGSASSGKCQLGTIFVLIHFYLMNATNEHFF